MHFSRSRDIFDIATIFSSALGIRTGHIGTQNRLATQTENDKTQEFQSPAVNRKSLQNTTKRAMMALRIIYSFSTWQVAKEWAKSLTQAIIHHAATRLYMIGKGVLWLWRFSCKTGHHDVPERRHPPETFSSHSSILGPNQAPSMLLEGIVVVAPSLHLLGRCYAVGQNKSGGR